MNFNKNVNYEMRENKADLSGKFLLLGKDARPEALVGRVDKELKIRSVALGVVHELQERGHLKAKWG